jgi:peptide/nickel transport system permease protein
MPGIAISITVLAVNLVASWMRLISDPQEREKQFARQMTIIKKRGRRVPVLRGEMGK